MAALIGMSGDVKGKTYPIDRDVINIGRSKDNAIVIDNPTVSGHHCSITRDGERHVLRDLESTNGTRLNSRDVTEARLRPKDLVQVGSVEFIFDSEKLDAVETHSYAETHVEVAPGPAAAPESFDSISPFGTRRKESKGFWFLLIAVVGLLALVVVVLYFIKLVTTQ
ncbi:MAG: FHA domain-containing protein [Verrucomicrobiota bacterium]